jgi:GNAT superfamily N-acetyltransferase
MMDIEQVLGWYDEEQRRVVEYPGLRREITTNVVRHVAPTTQDVRPMSSAEGIRIAMQVEDEVWETEHGELAVGLEEELSLAPGLLSIYIAYVEDMPASAGWIRFHEDGQFASLWGGSTLAAYRKRGLYSALLAARAQEAKARGVRFLTVDASPMSRPILEKLGFQLLTFAHACHWRVKRGT